jgi:mono/diheme cytochrome c family protein
VIPPRRLLPALAAAAFLTAAVNADGAAGPSAARSGAHGRPAVRPDGPALPGAPRTAADTQRTTLDGVYTLRQANTGKDVFASACQSCHSPTFHATPTFRSKWTGRTLGELFGYMRREMPQTDPGMMTDEEYLDVLAYMLRINGMPTGNAPLAGDSAALHQVRISFTDSAPSPPDSRR